jgi:energy-coupling factor transport system permease protein
VANARSWPHPVSLLLGSLVLVGCLIFVTQRVPLIALIILFLGAIVGIGWRVKVIMLKVLKLWPYLLLTFVLHSALSGGQSATFSLFPRFHINPVGIAAATFFTVRLIVILAVGIALFEAYSPQQYGRETSRALSRLPFLRRCALSLEMAIGLALQFVPFVEQEYRRLSMALAARGEPAGRALFHRLARSRTLFFPLMLNAFRRADQVSVALQARGYEPGVPRTSLNSFKMTATNAVFTIMFAMACLIGAWL